MRPLVVEDDDEMGALMERGLAAEGYRFTAVENGVESAHRARGPGVRPGGRRRDDAGDVRVELARRIREREDPVRILLVTARDAVDDRVFGLDAGADDYLAKRSPSRS